MLKVPLAALAVNPVGLTLSAYVHVVGLGLSWTTVTVNVCETMLLLNPPSLTVTVIVAEPKAEATGVKLMEPVVAGLV
jgi:hypothetical protein